MKKQNAELLEICHKNMNPRQNKMQAESKIKMQKRR